MLHAHLFCLAGDLPRRQDGDWCLLFSHPGDFEQRGFERARWLDLVRERFAAQRVMPAIQATAECQVVDGWVWSIDARTCFVTGAPSPTTAVPSPRFVAMIDPLGRVRGVHDYADGREAGSLFDVLARLGRLQSRADFEPASRGVAQRESRSPRWHGRAA